MEGSRDEKLDGAFIPLKKQVTECRYDGFEGKIVSGPAKKCCGGLHEVLWSLCGHPELLFWDGRVDGDDWPVLAAIYYIEIRRVGAALGPKRVKVMMRTVSEDRDRDR